MKTHKFTLLVAILASIFLLTSCQAIVDIFQAGMSFGIFLVLAVITLVIIVFVRLTRRR